MTQSSIVFQLAKGAEPIPGYVLEDRIGSGGYGEVWKATASGGLPKAIKFIYGNLEERRATRELKSLNRIRELNHPFLLTLERIETVAGHLVIVTELADRSLRDRFDQCVESGLPGVPREELLGYLAETAEALDYISDRHSFQHLDVKPENLLLSAGHVKVADFGLLKDLREISASLMSGLTPKYASPEVFHGRPAPHSDQYSLAIVYQEMATGELPFKGRTAATLASQHLHSAPELTHLMPPERFAIGKALSKDPGHRFRSCREFVARLMHRSAATILTSKADAISGRTREAGRVERGTASPSSDRAPAANDSVSAHGHDGQTIVLTAPETTPLPPPEFDRHAPAYRPTVFIGVGATGGKVLCRLRQSLADRFQDAAACPALQFLFIDTDVASITEATSGAGGGVLQEHEVLLLPLRRTWDYRARNLGNLNSISRRWIYNVPRSLRTEGVRALGRLALLDHARRVLDRLRTSISAAVDVEAVACTAEATGLEFREADPRVFLVGSIAGGTGGGMLLDLGYAARQILAETGLSDEDVCGILTYSTARNKSDRSFAPVNAYACLDELQHFSLPHNDYPGELACGLAGFREEDSTFKSTYLIDFGDDLTDEEFERAVNRLARYLLLSSASPASSFFDACRKAERDERGKGQLCLRTAALAPLGADSCSIRSEWIDLLCKSVIRNWRGGVDTTADDERIRLADYGRLREACDTAGPLDEALVELATQRASAMRLNVDHFAKSLDGMMADELGCAVAPYLKDIVSQSIDQELTEGDPRSAVSRVIPKIHAILGIDEASPCDRGGRIQTLCELTDLQVLELGRTLGDALSEWLLELVDTCDARVAGARRVVEWFIGHLQSLQKEARDRFRAAQADRIRHGRRLVERFTDSRHSKQSRKRAMTKGFHDYVERLIRELVLEGAFKTVGVIQPFVTACSDQLRDLWKDLNRLSEQFHAPSEGGTAGCNFAVQDESPAPVVVSPAEVFADHRDQMIHVLDRDVATGFFGAGRQLRHVLTQGSGLRGQFIAHMRAAARTVVLRTIKEATRTRLDEMLTESGAPDLRAPLEQCLGAARPNAVRAGGGATRLLIATADNSNAERLREEVKRVAGHEATMVDTPRGETLVCCEAEQIALEGVAGRFIRSRPDCEELAARLHTRTDVKW